MRNSVSAVFAIVLTTGLGFQSPAAAENVVTPDVVYGHKDGMAMTFDVFQPKEDQNGAGVLFMVSGGWVSQWFPPEMAGRFVNHLTDAGFTVFTVRHGSSPRYKVPDARADVDRAVRYIRLNADRFNVDPNRLGVYGGSAGGHLSLMLGLDADEGDPEAQDKILRESSRVAAVVAYYPPVDLRPSVRGPLVDRYPALDFEKELAPDVSPLLFVSEDDPPVLLIHGDADDLVPVSASESIYAEFQKMNVTSKLLIIEGGDHGFRDPEHRQEANAELVAWFEEHLLAE